MLKIELILTVIIIGLLGLIAAKMGEHHAKIYQNTVYSVTVDNKEYICNEYKITPLNSAKGGNAVFVGGDALTIGADNSVKITLIGEKRATILETVTKNFAVKQIKSP